MKDLNFSLTAKSRRLKLSIILLAMISSALPQLIFAQDKGLQLLPQLITEKQLPDPMAPLVLRVKLGNVRDLLRTVRMVSISDGRRLEVPVLKSYLDERDTPTYEFEIPSPLIEISYQFLVIDSDGSVVATNRHTVRRACAPSIELASIELPPDVQPDDKIKILFGKAMLVGDELKQYENVLKILDRVKALVEESSK